MSTQSDAQSIADALFAVETELANLIPLLTGPALVAGVEMQRKLSGLHGVLERKGNQYASTIGFDMGLIQGGGTGNKDN